MDKLLNDPSIMEQCAKLLSNPTVMQQMGELINNPDKMASFTSAFLNHKPPNDESARPIKHPNGTKVRIDGLSKSDLNGLTGTVQSYDASTTRYVVQLDDPTSKPISIKCANCTRVDGASDDFIL